ncbi:alginate export family protein [Sphingomonas sp.]|uniref:alginate export family protein n=1 Tax=Sphingomonas sp. TaxID=28214 RepID=UPI0025CC0C91|nr:alginate export family protein [Sphingomonas sp.]
MRALTLPLVLVALLATPAFADPITIKPVIDARLRYEHVDQEPLTRDADAVTARLRAGFEAKTGVFSFLAEAEGTLAIDNHYNSGTNGRTGFPTVADPQNVELNRLQLQYRGLPKTVVTVGRQRINLDDQRFVGSVGWRDNEQTFDAARVEWSGVTNLKADVTYSWSDRTIWGIDGGNRFGPARYQAIGGDNVFANVSLKTKVGTLTGFTYLVDQDEPLVLGFSSATYGGRFAGSHAIRPALKLTYAASYARQTDYARNPHRYVANYYAGELGLGIKAFSIGAGAEVLGADNGVALTSFQTPLATLHRFNGWADKFLVTPPDGLKDIYGSLGYGWKNSGPFDAISLAAIYHRYSSDRNDRRYGDEIDVSASAKVKRTSFTLKYANYQAHGFATETSKFWASIEWAI